MTAEFLLWVFSAGVLLGAGSGVCVGIAIVFWAKR